MSTKCSKCGFTNNPNDSYYCGNCGHQLSSTNQYKLYNAYYQTPVYNSTLNNYKKYEQQVKSSWFINSSEKIKEWWKEKKEDIVAFSIIIVACIVLLILFIFFFSYMESCSTKKIDRIKIGEKYGIGTDEDHLRVSAEYDSISAYSGSNQWILYDKTTGLQGLAYVTDSVTSIIKPSFVNVLRLSGDLAKLQSDTDGRSYFISNKGYLHNNQSYKRIDPVYFKDGKLGSMIATASDGKMLFLGNDGMPLDGKSYYNIICDEDSVIRATGLSSRTTTLHDYSGSQISDKEFYSVDNFSDGVAWSVIDKTDHNDNKYTLIDRSGNTLFSKSGVTKTEPFREGLGWYATSSSSWSSSYTAVDKSGKELFSLDAWRVYPFSMGLAPIQKGKSYSDIKMGFVDTTGKVVIPYKYTKETYPYFGPRDSLMTVSLDGVKGKLHRNGTFTPDSN